MAKIFYAWELGANLGHIGTFLPIARQMRSRQHTIHWAVAQTGQAARLLSDEGFDWLQAPVMSEQRREGSPLNYADILLRFGYAHALDLLGLVTAWRRLLQMTAASIVMADHAPSAILAARTLGLPVMLFGGSFFTPPLQHPTPNMRPWQAIPREHLLQIDAQALDSMNTVLQHFATPPLASVASLFEVAEQALLALPELDHYRDRGAAAYWGVLPVAVATPPCWPTTPGPKIFVYLRPESAHFEKGLAALLALGASVLVYAPGISSAQQARFASPGLRFIETPVDLGRAASEADAAVTNASGVTTAAFLLTGKPVLLIPGQLEQYLLALRVEEIGAGLLVDPEKPADDLPQKLQRVVFDPLFAGNAQAFARKYAAFPQEVVIANLVRRIEELCP